MRSIVIDALVIGGATVFAARLAIGFWRVCLR